LRFDLTAVKMVTCFWVVVLGGLVGKYQHVVKCAVSIFRAAIPEAGI
jgi:hypothetical protein